jgi:hypothetical protein
MEFLKVMTLPSARWAANASVKRAKVCGEFHGKDSTGFVAAHNVLGYIECSGRMH